MNSLLPDLKIKNPAPLPVRIVIFGDSISAYRDNLNVASLQLSERLKSEGIPFIFINSGVRGNTTEMGRARFQEDVLNHSPDVVIMAFGTNDAAVDVYLGKSEPRVTLERYSENLAFFLSELAKRNIQAILYSSPPVLPTEHPSKCTIRLDEYLACQRQLATDYSCFYVDVHKAFWDKAGGDGVKLLQDLYLPDGMHPNESGQTVIAEAIWQLWQEQPRILNSRAQDPAAELLEK
jgi:lysophospholipase L1-like esterase